MHRILIALLLLVACNRIPTPSGPEVADAVISCVTDRPSIEQTITVLRPLVEGGKSTEAFEKAKTAGMKIGGCAFAEVVQLFLHNRSAPPSGDAGRDVANTFERFRKEQAKGASFETMFEGRLVHL